MESNSAADAALTKMKWGRVMSGTFLIAGTTIGAGMLGIPLLTAQAGFLAASFTTIVVWLFMLATGLLIVEAALWMPAGANIMSIAGRLLGRKGEALAGGMFLFLYYCLMVAYFAGGAPLIASFFAPLGMPSEGVLPYVLFGVLFGGVVLSGAGSIARVNFMLVLGLVIAYIALIATGSTQVQLDRLTSAIDFPLAFMAVPVMFSAFGYHNIVPSLCQYLRRDLRSLRISVICGTLIALVVYVLWQWLVIGAVPLDMILKAKAMGQPASAALQAATGNPWIRNISAGFAFFALVTSFLGVSFSMVDFLRDGFERFGLRLKRWMLCLLALIPPLLCAVLYPAVFDKALGVAGGIGEAFLNGFLPVWLVWIGRYRRRLQGQPMLPGGKGLLVPLGSFAAIVFGIEVISSIIG